MSYLRDPTDVDRRFTNKLLIFIRRISQRWRSDEMVLPWITRAGYGVGHVLNDLCSAMWFLYFLMFLTHVDGMSDRHGAIVLLIGQIADALATPVIGVWSDRGSLGCLSRIGKRRSWYLLGKCKILVGGVLALGFVSSTFSGFTMKERTNDESDSERLTSEGATYQMERRTYLQIFSKLDLYKVALLYTSTRLFGNILQTFVALYVSETMQLSAVHVSAVPLAVYSASTISSIMAERMINLCGRKIAYCGWTKIFIADSLHPLKCKRLQIFQGQPTTPHPLRAILVRKRCPLCGNTLMHKKMSLPEETQWGESARKIKV
ncbi:unnamed protein product [Nesidiocoris tenuis]|uniref:Uncharacterized protein n=1 Tax=Nesidiocoris tenuis TaxID=355587 RepID=A0A6H5HLI6_9HEMI|nr:unnamed protein product [Nesidiocoris tenuis]